MDPLPDEILVLVARYVVRVSSHYTRDELVQQGRDLALLDHIEPFRRALATGSKTWSDRRAVDRRAVDRRAVRAIHRCACDYPCHQLYYEAEVACRTDPNRNRLRFSALGDVVRPDVPPVLLDMLFSGCTLPCALSLQSRFTDATARDVEAILRVLPPCVHSDRGMLRCRTHITPLYVAIVNEQVPLAIVRRLLEAGADPTSKIRVDNRPVGIMEDIYNCAIEDGDEALRRRWSAAREMIRKQTSTI